MTDTEPLERATLGPYRLLRRLGRGGMAEVFLAEAFGASGFTKRVALKTLLPELRGRPELERLLLAEARRAAPLSHRNLVEVHDLGVDDGIYYVRMSWVDGADLASLTARAPLPLPLAVLVAHEVACALAYLHAARDEAGRPLGLVHRDVSPANILLSRAGDVKLGDLGLAKATTLAEITRANVVKGKYAYLSPEQVTGAPLTAASDQFSLGITLYELATGRRPFDGDTPLETMQKVRDAALPPLDPLPAELRPIVARCLAQDPAARFPNAETLALALSSTFPLPSPFTLSHWLHTTLP